MKRIVKLALVALPALLFAATVGLTTMGCDDDTTTNPPPDMTAVPDLSKAGG